MKCDRCGETMRPMLTSLYCPNSCDLLAKNGHNCPNCGSGNTEKFDISGILDCFAANDDIRDSVTFHCWPCGHVWNTEVQKPETD